jgi:outer membrane protein OmpA-like peptidoglycan-associated protein
MNMRRVIYAALCSAAFVVVSACAYDPEKIDDAYTVGYEIDAVRAMAPQGPAFNRGLRQGYLEYGDTMYEETDVGDYYHFAFKAVDSAKGEQVFPDALESRDIPGAEVEELAAARARLMAALNQTGRKKAPWQAAAAQTAFDCWLERVEDEDDPALVEVCKGRFQDAIAEVERSLVTEGEDVYLVFFAWDQDDLSPVASTVLDQVEADYALGRPARIVVAGHADLSGPEAYNLGLSADRARNVARALIDQGIPEDAIVVEWHGETRPRVPTPDGVREPQNRRVEIVFGGAGPSS